LTHPYPIGTHHALANVDEAPSRPSDRLMSMSRRSEPDYLNGSKKTLLWVSAVIGLLFTANQGVGVTGWLYELNWGWWAVGINFIRNVLLATATIFVVLYIARGILRRRGNWSSSSD